MFAAVTSVVLVGVDPVPVRVEVHLGGGVRSLTHIVGLPDTAVREARERVRAALASLDQRFPAGRVTINLSPADVPKAGSAYDLPIAIGVLAAAGVIPIEASRIVALGELALDGGLRAARGGLGAALVARRLRLPCVLPADSAREAGLVADADVRVSSSLGDAVRAARGEGGDPIAPVPVVVTPPVPDLADVRGQGAARRGLELAAAGGHHLLLSGAPGAGKTLLARCLPGILPRLSDDEALETAQAWAARGSSRPDPALPPFRSPHHSATPAALLGGGSGIPVPGELSMASHGVLFLDELGEFPAHLLDGLRQPLEEQSVAIARQGRTVRFPCAVQVVAATNPCPCGFRDDELEQCRCSPSGVERYRRRLSGPLLDRFDLRIGVRRVAPTELAGAASESSAAVRDRVAAARRRQHERGGLNRDLTGRELESLSWEPDARSLLHRAVTSLRLTARGWDRVRRVAVTAADLEGCEAIAPHHVAEALAVRGTDP